MYSELIAFSFIRKKRFIFVHLKLRTNVNHSVTNDLHRTIFIIDLATKSVICKSYRLIFLKSAKWVYSYCPFSGHPSTLLQVFEHSPLYFLKLYNTRIYNINVFIVLIFVCTSPAVNHKITTKNNSVETWLYTNFS